MVGDTGTASSTGDARSDGAVRWQWWLPPLAWSGVLFFLATRPPAFFAAHVRLPGDVSRGLQEAGMHVGAFLLLAILLRSGTRRAWPGIGPGGADGLCLVGASLVSVATELGQIVVPSRAFELSDLAFNFLGAVLGLGLTHLGVRARAAAWRHRA